MPDVPTDEIVAELTPKLVGHALKELVEQPITLKGELEADADLVLGTLTDMKVNVAIGCVPHPTPGEFGQRLGTNPVPEFPHSGDDGPLGNIPCLALARFRHRRTTSTHIQHSL